VRAAAILFDSFGTLFDMEALRQRLASIGVTGLGLELWRARTVRDGIALSATGTFRPYREVAQSALVTLIAELGNRPDPSRVEEVMAGFSDLPCFRDVRPALTQLAEGGTRRAILTNGSAEETRALLAKSGVQDMVQPVVSIDDVQRWKPFPEPYQRAAKELSLEPRQVAFVSSLPWDVEGARRAGMFGILLQRRGGHHQPAMPPPDLTIAGLAELAQVGARIDP